MRKKVVWSLRRLLGPAVAVLVIGGTNAAADSETLTKAKTLYAEASYEEALAALSGMDPTATREPEALQYRALCLYALGRAEDAQLAVESLVTSAPTFVPPTGDLSPKLVALFTDVRRKLLPGITRRMFADAREQFHAKAHDRALRQFEQVLELTADPLMQNAPESTDLRTLASGFVDLARAAAPAPAPAPAPAAPAVAEAAPVVSPNVGVRPPVPVRQVLPDWVPPDAAAKASAFNGSLKVLIGADGRVKSASMVRPSHPRYDALLMQAARQWVYKPAMKKDVPVESEKIIEVQLRKQDE